MLINCYFHFKTQMKEKFFTFLYKTKNFNFFNLINPSRQLHSFENDIPVIRIPKYLENNLGNAIYKEHVKTKKSQSNLNRQKLNKEHFNKLIISFSGDKKLNHYYGRGYNPNNVPLISKNWLKEKSISE